MIENTPEYRQMEAGREATQPQQAATVGDALGPVTNWEKGDAEFWVQVAQLAVLLLILREVSA